jgi:hypothetical protein
VSGFRSRGNPSDYPGGSSFWCTSSFLAVSCSPLTFSAFGDTLHPGKLAQTLAIA